MSSFWKDLLYVHSRMLWREDLLWRDETCAASVRGLPSAPSRTRRIDCSKATGPKSPKKDASSWPRLSAPR